MEPPIRTINGGCSFIKIHAQRGPNIASDIMMIPTTAEGVVLAPIVIKINPRPT